MESYTGQQSFAGTELMTISNTGDYQIGQCDIYPNHYYPFWEKEVHHYYPSVSYVTEKNKIEQAFKIVRKLLEKKIINNINVAKFMDLVHEIASII